MQTLQPTPRFRPFSLLVLLLLVLFTASSLVHSDHEDFTQRILLPSQRNAAAIMTFMMPSYIHIPTPNIMSRHFPYKLFLYRENHEGMDLEQLKQLNAETLMIKPAETKTKLNGFPLLFIPQAQHGSFSDVRSLGATLYEMNGHAKYRKETYAEAGYIQQMVNELADPLWFGSNQTTNQNNDKEEGNLLLGFDVFTIDFNDGEWSNFHSSLHARQAEYIKNVVEFILKAIYKNRHKKILIVSHSSEHTFENISQDLLDTAFILKIGEGRVNWDLGAAKNNPKLEFKTLLQKFKKQMLSQTAELNNSSQPNTEKETKPNEMYTEQDQQLYNTTRSGDVVNVIGASFIPHIFSNIDKSAMKWCKQLQQQLATILLSLVNSGANSQAGLLDLSQQDKANILSQYFSLKANSFEKSFLLEEIAAKREKVNMAKLNEDVHVELTLNTVQHVSFTKKGETKFFKFDVKHLQHTVNQLYLFTNFYRTEVDVFVSEDLSIGGEAQGPALMAKQIGKLNRQQITLLPYLDVDEDHLETFNTNEHVVKVMIKIPEMDTSFSKKMIFVRVKNLYSVDDMSAGKESKYPERYIVVASHPGTLKGTVKNLVKENYVHQEGVGFIPDHQYEEINVDNSPHVHTVDYSNFDFWKSGETIHSNKSYIVIPNLSNLYAYKLRYFNNECSNRTLYPVLQYHYGNMFEYESHYLPMRFCGENVINLQFLNLTDINNADDENLYGIALYFLNTKNGSSFNFKIELDYEETFIHTMVQQHYHTIIADIFAILLMIIACYGVTHSLIYSFILTWIQAPLLIYLQFIFTPINVLYVTDFSILHLAAAFIYSLIAVLFSLNFVRAIMFLLGFIGQHVIPFRKILWSAIPLALLGVSFKLDPSIPLIVFTFLSLFIGNSASIRSPTYSLLTSLLKVLCSLILMGPSAFSYIKEWMYWYQYALVNANSQFSVQTLFSVAPHPSLTAICSPYYLIPFYLDEIVQVLITIIRNRSTSTTNNHTYQQTKKNNKTTSESNLTGNFALLSRTSSVKKNDPIQRNTWVHWILTIVLIGVAYGVALLARIETFWIIYLVSLFVAMNMLRQLSFA
ncbi:hypothetical protein C9374_012390 [Naegleria lovaniensis]|uniref:GPI inositol-deacylase PGAP1-like alpha/beta domain-containing protein n=1 Tax=Naegleria lovaniensis TaxID=51637 RepID=A0AA88KNI4_NAELO|nr:uncharacterized protein C9374_012390 [Naegleria lovaniensis]KAG2392138.1 hypothetical protein C9374_012390 [Naegleria lovaniensis]